MCQKNRIIPEAAMEKKRFHPAAQLVGVTQTPVLHRLFQPARIGKAADRKGRRHPGHQSQQRGNAAFLAHASAVIMMVVPVIMAMRVPAMSVISAACRLERLFHLAHCGAQAFQHGANDMVTQDENALLLDLRRKMPVAQMPGELDQVKAVLRLDLEQLFIRGANLDQIAVFDDQQVAMGKQYGFLQVQHHHLVILQMQKLAAQMPLVMCQRDVAGGLVAGGSGGAIGGDAQHAMIRFRNSLGEKIFDG
ncbi:hypothetical protein AT6N2_C3222 [Agrobacterium tumefaciens]|nr:hypothetical protein AT6N2_C3222 [Agrobacterium tumefaciens]